MEMIRVDMTAGSVNRTDMPVKYTGWGGRRLTSLVYAKVTKELPFTGKLLPALGTAGLVGPVNSLGAFPNFNATKGTMEGWEDISGETLARIMTERKGKSTHLGCSQCIIRCSNEFVDEDGQYVTSSLEYETIWAMGG